MAGLHAARWLATALLAIALLVGGAPRSWAVEALDGRFQAHGFVEMQIRALNSAFAEELDLSQWYNVLNVEVEFDILPDGWGPFDLLQAYVRAEGRYDAVYLGSQVGGAMLPNVRTWGNRSRRLPRRLRDATDDDFGGAIDANQQVVPPGRTPRVPTTGPTRRNPVAWVEFEDEEREVLDYSRDAGGNLLRDPRNPVDQTDVDMDGIPDNMAFFNVFTRAGATAGRILLVEDCNDGTPGAFDTCCTRVECRTLPANVGRDFRVGCTNPVDSGGGVFTCDSADQVLLPPGSTKVTTSKAIRGMFHRLLDRGSETVIDPLTGEEGTVPELYGRVTTETGQAVTNDAPSFVNRIDGAARDAAGNLIDPATGLPPSRTDNLCVLTLDTGECIDNLVSDAKTAKRVGFPGFDTLFDNEGADGYLADNPFYDRLADPDAPLPEAGDTAQEAEDKLVPRWRALTFKNDDPAEYLFAPVRDFEWTFRTNAAGARGGTGQTVIMGPWLPRNFFQSLATLRDRANPFRGRRTPTVVGGRIPETDPNSFKRNAGVRFQQLDADAGLLFDPDDGTPVDADTLGYPVDPIDPRLSTLNDYSILAASFGVDLGPGFFTGAYPNSSIGTFFGGDFSGIVPCWEPQNGIGRDAYPSGAGTTRNVQQLMSAGAPSTSGCIPYTNVKVVGGLGELPMRVAPDLSNLVAGLDLMKAQGIFYPSPGLIRYIEEGGDFDEHEFNLNEMERSFNRGASQRENYELKEAYLDMEFLDSRLWIRAGLQNIVWGKTELFRTTDQFNPQDFALASLPSLEESRVALLSARAVYSLYDVGPLEDVRVELGANFDRFKPADLGACGEPYTIDVVCALTTGFALHSLSGIGIAGVDRPPNAWNDVDGLEFGGRIEFRWDRFSFAIADFYGYNDFPYPEPIYFFERNIDVNTGRPRKAFATGPCENAGGFRGYAGVFPSSGITTYTAGNAALAETDPTAVPSGHGVLSTTKQDDYEKQLESMTISGIGIDSACLKPGGVAGGPNENRFDPEKGGLGFEGAGGLPRDPSDTDQFANYLAFINTTVANPGNGFDPGQWTLEGSSVDFALVNHPANQQLFSFVCLGTATIAAAISPESCAWNIFGTSRPLIENTSLFLSDYFSATFAGETDAGTVNFFLATLTQQTKDIPASGPVPTTPLNRDTRDGRTTITVPSLLAPDDQIIFGTQILLNTGRWAALAWDADRKLSMDSTLTVQQRALLGCGPFYGTRCDSATSVSLDGETLYQPDVGGIDVLNAEGSIVVGAFPGLEGTGSAEFGGLFVPFTEPRLLNSIDSTPLPDGSLDDDCTEDPPPADCVNYPGVGDDALIKSWVTWNELPQPGTTGTPGFISIAGDVVREPDPFPNDAYCTRFDPGNPMANELGLVRLPGCRGASEVTVNRSAFEADGVTPKLADTIDVVFEKGYDPAVDGCIYRPQVVDNTDPMSPVVYTVRAVSADGGADPDVDLSTCASESDTRFNFSVPWGNPGAPAAGATAPTGFFDPSIDNSGPRTVYHPYASCNLSSAFLPTSISLLCDIQNRDYDTDYVNGRAQVFRTEMHAWSWNFLNFLVISTCNARSGGDDIEGEPDCFNPETPFAMDRCSYSQPQFCRNVKGFLSVAGLGRNNVRAGGNPQYGRREFLWHSGGEAVLRYKKRNVLGYSMDFAEDVTKTNWGMEFTWIGKIPFPDTNSMNFITESDTFNLTISVDRPTFINFLNANRTFFMNSQWFFQYIPEHGSGFFSTGPFNVLFTFAVFTGYFQDRFLPQFVTVYDFRSQSGGFLPQISYRFTEAFSVTFGISWFIGRGERIPMPVRGIAPNGNRAGPQRYTDGTERLLSLIRFRDEAFMRLRWTF